MKKRGQFYLLAALVIIGILVGLSTVYNAARTPREDTTISYLTEEIKYESYQTINNAVYKKISPKENLEVLINAYKSSNPNHDILAIYDDTESTTFFPRFSDSTEITITLGAEQTTFNSIESSHTFFNNYTGEIIVEFNGQKTIFETKQEPTFNVIVQNKEGEQTYLATSPPEN